MGDTVIKWTPRGEVSEQTLNLSQAGVVFRVQRVPVRYASTSISVGRKAVTVARPSYTRYEVEVVSVYRQENPSGSVFPFMTLSSWRSHAQAGGEFAFMIDDDTDFATTLNGSHSQGDVSLTLTDSASGNVSVGDVVYLEDANDSTKWEERRVQLAPANIVVNEGISYSLADLSIVRHADYFPACVLVLGSLRIPERQGGKGAEIFDLRFQFETVR